MKLILNNVYCILQCATMIRSRALGALLQQQAENLRTVATQLYDQCQEGINVIVDNPIRSRTLSDTHDMLIQISQSLVEIHDGLSSYSDLDGIRNELYRHNTNLQACRRLLGLEPVRDTIPHFFFFFHKLVMY